MNDFNELDPSICSQHGCAGSFYCSDKIGINQITQPGQTNQKVGKFINISQCLFFYTTVVKCF